MTLILSLVILLNMWFIFFRLITLDRGLVIYIHNLYIAVGIKMSINIRI